MSAGYSKTPLAKKLGIKDNFSVLLYNEPKHYFDLFEDLPNSIKIIQENDAPEVDFIHLFCKTIEELQNIKSNYKNRLKKNGLLWVSWPKGTSNMKTDLKRDLIRNHFLEIGLVDVKVAAIDEDWSGLKFVYRVKDR